MSPAATRTETVQLTTEETASNGTSRHTTIHAEHPPSIDEGRVGMPKFPSPPVFKNKYDEREYLKGRLAAAFRIFGKYGFDEGVAGHITLRDPVDPSTFWVNPFGVAFSLIKRSDLIQVDHKGKVIAGGPCRLLNAAAFMIHSAVHDARPDVMCAAHSHSIYGRTFCSLGRSLDMITQDSCAFHNVASTIVPSLRDAEQFTGSRGIQAIQRHCLGGQRRQGDSTVVGQQQSRATTESWAPDRWRQH